MAFSSFLIVLVIFILAGVIIIRPFFMETTSQLTKRPEKFDSLLAEKERLLSSIEDLDLEFELDKISPQEHTRSRDLLLTEAADVLRQLDKYTKPAKTKKQVPAPLEVDDELEKMITARRQELTAEKSKLCPNCGKTVQEGDQFCSFCGGAL